MPLELDAEAPVVLQRFDCLVERGKGFRIDPRRVDGELDLLLQLELVRLDDHLLVDRATVVRDGSRDVRAQVVPVRRTVVVPIGLLRHRPLGSGRCQRGRGGGRGRVHGARAELQAESHEQDFRIAAVEVDASGSDDLLVADVWPQPEVAVRAEGYRKTCAGGEAEAVERAGADVKRVGVDPRRHAVERLRIVRALEAQTGTVTPRGSGTGSERVRSHGQREGQYARRDVQVRTEPVEQLGCPAAAEIESLRLLLRQRERHSRLYLTGQIARSYRQWTAEQKEPENLSEGSRASGSWGQESDHAGLHLFVRASRRLIGSFRTESLHQNECRPPIDMANPCTAFSTRRFSCSQASLRRCLNSSRHRRTISCCRWEASVCLWRSRGSCNLALPDPVLHRIQLCAPMMD